MDRSDLHGLRTFLTIVKSGTLRSAGDALGVNASAVSKQLKAFEDSLGTALFVRIAACHKIAAMITVPPRPAATDGSSSKITHASSVAQGISTAPKRADCAVGMSLVPSLQSTTAAANASPNRISSAASCAETSKGDPISAPTRKSCKVDAPPAQTTRTSANLRMRTM